MTFKCKIFGFKKIKSKFGPNTMLKPLLFTFQYIFNLSLYIGAFLKKNSYLNNAFANQYLILKIQFGYNRIVAKCIFFKLMKTGVRLELDLYEKKKLFWVPIFPYFAIKSMVK